MAQESHDQGDSKKQDVIVSAPEERDPNDDEDETVDSEAAGEEEEEEDDDDDDEEEDEPKLKYVRMTSHLGPLYRNGDATSTFLVAGDKMVGIRLLENYGFC